MKFDAARTLVQRPAAEVRIFEDLESLSRAAASLFIDLANEAIRGHGAFRVALSGGSTPTKLYSLLATPEFSAHVPWRAVHLFWGDERCVPPDDPESNYGMVRQVLLQRIQIPATNVHRMRGEIDPDQGAAEYEALLREAFGTTPNKVPRFDLVLLGLGEDGHTASLFPGASALQETERLAVAVYVKKLQAYRMTLTRPVIVQSAVVAFLVAGESKRSIVARVLRGSDGAELPAQRVWPTEGKLIWFLDIPAAAEISPVQHLDGSRHRKESRSGK